MKTKNILIIHRDDHIRREMHRILSHFDFKLTYADDGLHGLYAAKAGRPDLIISEVDLSILSGLDLGKMLRNDDLTKNIPLILLHESLDFICINKAKKINAMAFLIAPYLDNSLIYAIKRSLNEDVLKVNHNREALKYEDCRTTKLISKVH